MCMCDKYETDDEESEAEYELNKKSGAHLELSPPRVELDLSILDDLS